jgi:hypothetical protein
VGAAVSATEDLQAAHAAGITVAADGEALLLEAAAEPAQALLGALAQHKQEILALLRRGDHRSTLERSCTHFDERCGTAAKNGMETEAVLEDLELKRRVVEWLNLHPAPSAPGSCAWCGQHESPGAVVLPFGTEPNTHTWLHAECWPAWHKARWANAIAAVKGDQDFGPTSRPR